MRLYRLGDTGEPVRDIQERLAGLDLDPHPDPRGEFGEYTRRSVADFQRSRGLNADGIVGSDTWRALYEAGYRLGDRLLFMRRPMLRGEDVAELQSRLNGLGFDAGKVDAVFGPETQRAVLDFQRNRHLAEDGRAGPSVVTEIRLVTRETMGAGREAVREREWLRALPDTVVGSRVYLDAACRSEHEAAHSWAAASAAAVSLQERGGVPLLSRSSDTTLTERVRVRRANRLGAELVISFTMAEQAPRVYYFASAHSTSEAGRMLAGYLGDRLECETEGRATPILKETRAPAVVVSSPDLTDKIGLAVVEGIVTFFQDSSHPHSPAGQDGPPPSRKEPAVDPLEVLE
ncbi:N-acetylmuramoyl-L-alanine amidase [soil metagenome]